jgi:uncharacterized RDD family membrane protein YckC
MFNTSVILKKRVYALTTDLFIIVMSNYFFMASFTNFLKTIFFHLSTNTQIFMVNKLSLLSPVLLTTLTFSYFSIFYFVTNGHTMGKIIFGLKVVSQNGDITLKQSIQRSLAYLSCAFFGSFLFALSFIRKDDKSLADIFSKTDVILDVKIENPEEIFGTEFQLSLIEEKKAA